MSSAASVLSGLTWELGLIGLLAAAAVLAGATALRSFLSPARDAVVARIDRVITSTRPVVRTASEAKTGTSPLARLMRVLAALSRPTRAEELSMLRGRLARAGLRSDHAMETFLATKLILAAVATAVFLNINSQLPRGLHFPVVAGAALVVCAAGFFLPNVWLSLRIGGRQQAIERSLPDTMDLLVTCVEAGLGLDAAISRVAGELKLAAPILANELNVTFLEIQAGMARRDAFRRLAERTGVDDLRELAAVLTQTELFGTSVAKALVIHADGMRVRRMLDAERRAAMVGVKMTFPLVLCILPSLVAVVMGPALVTIATKILDLH